jgi:hypothetical protein
MLCNLRTQDSRFRKEQHHNEHSRRTCALPTQKAPPGRISFATGKKTY